MTRTVRDARDWLAARRAVRRMGDPPVMLAFLEDVRARVIDEWLRGQRPDGAGTAGPAWGARCPPRAGANCDDGEASELDEDEG